MRIMLVVALLVSFGAGDAQANPKKFMTFAQAKKKFGLEWALGYEDAKQEYVSGGMPGVAERISFYTSCLGGAAGYLNTSTSSDIGHAIDVVKSANEMRKAALKGDVVGMFEAYYDAANTIFQHGGDAVGRRQAWRFVLRLRGALGLWKELVACKKTAESLTNKMRLWTNPISDGPKTFNPKKDPPAKELDLYAFRSKTMVPRGTTGDIRGDFKVDWKAGPGKDGAWHVHRNKDGSYQRYLINARGSIEIEGLPYWKSLKDMLAARERIQREKAPSR